MKKLNENSIVEMYKTMLKIRKFEQVAMNTFAEGKIPGFVHLYIGEEAVATGVCANLKDSDYITSTHRGHGHILAKGGDLKFMMAELFGKATGYCKGKGGSMHIADATKGILGANGIVGAGHNIAVGAGLSAQYRGTDQVCVCFFGDASTNQGTFHESLNMASVWKLPVVFVCENNLYGISMSQNRHQAIKDVADRGVAYNVPGIVVDGNDVFAVYEAAKEAIKRAREGKGPTLIECKTYRHRGHFEGDPCVYKPTEEQEEWLAKDPIPRFEKYLVENEILTEEKLKKVQNKVESQIDEAVDFANNSPYPELESVLEDVYTDIKEEVR
ncbi:pyruvate dehydrogenase (acetyl-transferring) E1 component subunit alpha [Clostridium botulinum]|uniref:Pyruvate dehydrogenase E1 component subunit alpha n=1 Tax=Clostridium botulinum (strain Kyoto / Type A2) TaxID=536232 RepID=C1FN96_CLOBJ|nr:pyruvate dehydrogenase (acetyl-transferring) E1 component subunit alpha [Clostridium botulinum]ACO85559.1 TPP-dependent acetoin dehydrogenase complex, E1 component, alpha subunit [Clostridium botulinum A2 str. Kyoto]APQ78430.1 pyruvate dehydrogenase (acetyl-transferring) E1 component, alpha subunit [Clostridium botulinum]AUM99064.1 pyruvate dehydrogenase (acetyl-transferring) E1 component subunit alpha [Clostridium botulinum]AUN06839.1 pyruvate dehydrogenase (acetyl-transferring) E1 componen